MTETLESAVTQKHDTEIGSETDKIVNSRAEIDTSQPFESVKEAVIRFGGSGSWIPLHMLRLAATHDTEEFELDIMEEQAAQLENDLIVKERETLNILKELEATKRCVEGLKLNLVKEVFTFLESSDLSSESQMSTPNEKSVGSLSLCPVPSPGLILEELNQAKLNLNKTTNDLAVIRASVESLNKKTRKGKKLLEKSCERQVRNSAGVFSVEENPTGAKVKPQIANDAGTKGVPGKATNISRDVKQFNFEAEQYNKMAEGAAYEVVKAMSDIEQTKTNIKMVEMRLTAAKRMEEAARAVEAIALAERKALSNDENSSYGFLQKTEGITLSYEEYSALTHKAKKAEDGSKNNVLDANSMNHINAANPSKVALRKKREESINDIKHDKKSLEEVLDKLVAEEGHCRDRSEYGQVQYSGHNSAKFKFRNSNPPHSHQDTRLLDGKESNLIKDKSVPVFRSMISIGDILSKKLILQDDILVDKHMEGHTKRREVSLSQMLREQSGLILHPPKSTKNGIVDKPYYAQKKKLGFFQVSLPMTKHSKKKMQVLNLR